MPRHCGAVPDQEPTRRRASRIDPKRVSAAPSGIAQIFSTVSPDAVATAMMPGGDVPLIVNSGDGDDQEIVITGPRLYYNGELGGGGDPGGDNTGTGGGGGEGGSGGSGFAVSVAQHTQDCGTEDGAAVQVANKVKGALPPGVSGPVDPVKTSTGNDWTKVEFGAIIVKNSDGSFGALNDTIYSNNLPNKVQIQYNTAQPVQGLWHSHSGADVSSDQRLIGRYPSLDDWDMLDRIKAGAGAVSDPSLWIMDAFGTTREFKFSERDYFKNLHNEATKMKEGEGLEGRERAASCG